MTNELIKTLGIAVGLGVLAFTLGIRACNNYNEGRMKEISYARREAPIQDWITRAKMTEMNYLSNGFIRTNGQNQKGEYVLHQTILGSATNNLENTARGVQ